jgi:hypothetical protein
MYRATVKHAGPALRGLAKRQQAVAECRWMHNSGLQAAASAPLSSPAATTAVASAPAINAQGLSSEELAAVETLLSSALSIRAAQLGDIAEYERNVKALRGEGNAAEGITLAASELASPTLAAASNFGVPGLSDSSDPVVAALLASLPSQNGGHVWRSMARMLLLKTAPTHTDVANPGKILYESAITVVCYGLMF